MMLGLGRLCLLGLVAVPLLSAVVAAVAAWRGRRPDRVSVALGWVTVAAGLVAAGIVGRSGRFGASVAAGTHHPVAGLWADPLTISLAVFICGVGAVVKSYSGRFLVQDPAAARFLAGADVVIAGMVVVAASATAADLVVGWVLAGSAFSVVVGYRPDLPGVAAAARRTRRHFAAGDLALVAAVCLIGFRAGNVELTSSDALQHAAARLGGLSTLVAVLVVIAALARCAQGPLAAWLPGTVSAPSPACALLHAGVVNGGGVLLIRFGPLATGSRLAVVLSFVAAASTAVVAGAVMNLKADVKGELAYSTMSQMGFMIAECGVGAYLAAAVHLVGHGAYKATLFFGAGNQVRRRGSRPDIPPTRMPDSVRALVSGLAAAGTAAAVWGIPHAGDHRGAGVLLVFAAATAATAAWTSTGTPWPPGLALLATGALIAAGALYGALLGGVSAWVAPAIPTAGPGAFSPWFLLTIAAAAGALRLGLRVGDWRQRWMVLGVHLGAAGLSTPAGHRRSAPSPRSVPTLAVPSWSQAGDH